MLRILDPQYQEKHYKELSDIIGWNSIQRRNIGFLEALIIIPIAYILKLLGKWL